MECCLSSLSSCGSWVPSTLIDLPSLAGDAGPRAGEGGGLGRFTTWGGSKSRRGSDERPFCPLSPLVGLDVVVLTWFNDV